MKHALLSTIILLAATTVPAPLLAQSGDVSGNGIINTHDSQLLRDHLLGQSQLNLNERTRADGNQDGLLDIADTVYIHLHSAPGMLNIEIDVTPDAGSWTLTGPAGFAAITETGDRSGSSSIVNAQAGDYTLICDNNLTGYDPPPMQTLTLTTGSTIVFTPTYEAEGTDAISITLPGGVPLELVRIPAGSFQMGSDDPGWGSELPVHTVSIGYDFYMGKYEVTQAQWEAVMGSNPSVFGGKPNNPVETVSWDSCQLFIDAINQMGWGTFRLPSEAEWEYACRAGTTTRFYFGDSDCSTTNAIPCELDDYAWWEGNCQQSGPNVGHKEVGQKLPNAFSLYDMHGNVYELCQDSWHRNYIGAPTYGGAWESPEGSTKVVRGGSWTSFPPYCRSSFRDPFGSGSRSNFRGLRLWRTVHSGNTGTISIDVMPDSGSWTLTGPAEFRPIAGSGDRTGDSTITNAPLGDYTLICDDNVPGFNPPSTQTLTLTTGGSITFIHNWTSENSDAITITLPGGVPLELVRIPTGSFQMGSSDPGWSYSNEQPVHTVNINYEFHLGKYEVTQAQWEAVMGSNPARNHGIGDNYPVYYVSWNDCQLFIEALNQMGWGTFRLPSEAEWEYACRAGTTTRFYFGDSDCSTTTCTPCELDNYAWWCGNNSPSGTKEVGQKWPNAFGLYDMHGNVMESCQDYWHANYDGAPGNGTSWESPTSPKISVLFGFSRNRSSLRGGRPKWGRKLL